MNKDIYAFDDPVEFISERLSQITPPLTHRDFATRLGLSSPATLNHILSRYRKISVDLIAPIAKALELSASEERFFELLVQFYRAKKATDKEIVFTEMQKIRIRSNCFQIDLKHHAYFGAWYYAPLLEILHYKQIPYSEASSLGRQLKPSITSQDAKRAIDRMIELEMIEIDTHGIMQRIPKIISSEGLPISILRGLNREFFDLAKGAQDIFERDDRNISSVTMAMSEESFRMVSGKIDELRRLILSIDDPKDKMDRVMQFTFAAHPLTKLQGYTDED